LLGITTLFTNRFALRTNTAAHLLAALEDAMRLPVLYLPQVACDIPDDVFTAVQQQNLNESEGFLGATPILVRFVLENGPNEVHNKPSIFRISSLDGNALQLCIRFTPVFV